jgi:hypothetical protein
MLSCDFYEKFSKRSENIALNSHQETCKKRYAEALKFPQKNVVS